MTQYLHSWNFERHVCLPNLFHPSQDILADGGYIWDILDFVHRDLTSSTFPSRRCMLKSEETMPLAPSVAAVTRSLALCCSLILGSRRIATLVGWASGLSDLLVTRWKRIPRLGCNGAPGVKRTVGRGYLSAGMTTRRWSFAIF
jgi:hypothetical protein